MTDYKINFTKTIYGFFIINAKNEEEALKKFYDGDIDEEYDNKSDYIYDKNEKGEPKVYT